MSPSPIGTVIGKGRDKYMVGRKIGNGACAVVYELNDAQGKPTDFAIKVTPEAKKTAKPPLLEVQNASLLNYERMVYQNHFAGIQGKLIPSIPSKGPPVMSNVNGFHLFVMERMESPLSSIVPALLQHEQSTATISVGPIAVKLLTCLQGIHETKHILRDVKADNFMLARGEGNGQTFEEKLASRVRLLDLAFVTQYTSHYLADRKTGGIVGTPLYASLNVHANVKATRRDDLEALGYVIAELLIQLSSADTSMKLPWSHGQSDDEVFDIKRTLVEEPDSLFYKQLGDKKTISVFAQYLNAVRAYKFKEKPDYEDLAIILAELTVPRSKSMSTGKTASKKSPRRTTTQRPTGASQNISSKRLRTMRTRSNESEVPAIATRKISATIDVDGSDNENAEMDWEHTNETIEPELDHKPQARPRIATAGRLEKFTIDECNNHQKKKKYHPEPATVNKDDDDDDGAVISGSGLQRRGVKVVVTSGPHYGESYSIEDGRQETFVFGSNPTAKVGKNIALTKDNALAATHVRLDLSMPKKMKPLVVVTDKSNGQTKINNLSVRRGKAFTGDIIRIGETILKIEVL